jgi:hypothetical protein
VRARSSPADLSAALHWYCDTDLRWHDLRRTGAVLAAQTGATLAELMGRLGHATPAAALGYQHVARGRDREIAACFLKWPGIVNLCSRN